MAIDDETIFSVTNVGDYQSDKRSGTVTQGSFYPRILENRNIGKISLYKGLENFKDEYGTEKDQLHSLLTYNEKVAKPGETLQEVVQSAEFVCDRSLLKYLLEPRAGGPPTVLAARFNGTIFMCSEEVENEQNIKGIYYGAKFQQMMTDMNYYTKPVTNEKLSKTVLRGVLENLSGKHIVLYSAQIDGIDSDNKKVELKMCPGAMDNFWVENRSKMWFMQAYLTNVETIIVGEKIHGKIKKIYPLKTSEIPSMVKGKWSKADCLNSLHTILSELKKSLPVDGTAKKIEFKDEGISSTDVEMSSVLTESFMRRFAAET